MENLLLIHKVSVILFLVIYLVKTALLLSNQITPLEKITRVTKAPEMIVSVLFLVTGIWMFVEIGAIKQMQIIKLIAVFVSIPLAVVGFKKRNKGLALMSLILIIAAYGLAEMSKKKPYGAKEISATANGVEIYATNCAMCHGEDGKKGLAAATDLSTSALSKEEAVAVITDGRKNMAAYKNVLSTEQIDAVADYIQTLKK